MKTQSREGLGRLHRGGDIELWQGDEWEGLVKLLKEKKSRCKGMEVKLVHLVFFTCVHVCVCLCACMCVFV